MEKLVFDPWLSQILHRDTYQLKMDAEVYESYASTFFQNVSSKPFFIYAKVSCSDIRYISFLEKQGFHLIDTHILFEKPYSLKYERKEAIEVKVVTADQEDAVVDLARRVFIYSRFHLDPAFPSELANQVKAAWIRNFFKGQRGSALMVAHHHHRVVGFLLVIQKSHHLVIDLIGVDQEFQRQGIARDLIAFAEDHCAYSQMIQVGTQVSNLPSIRFYEQLGFKMIQTNYVFHYHSMGSILKNEDRPF